MKELLKELRDKVLYLRNTGELSVKGELLLLHKLNAIENNLNIPREKTRGITITSIEDNNIFECKVCGKPFGDQLSLYHHYDQNHN